MSDRPENDSDDSSLAEQEQVLVGRYKIVGRLGSGAIGTVYKARDMVLKREVALKLLRSGGSRTQEQLVRLQREARAICQLKHANIIDVYDFILGDGNVPILAMEYVEGESLEELVERNGPLEPLAAASIFEQISSALSYAHGRHIMHRDLKPSNVLVPSEKQFKIKIIDFGVAKLLDEDGSLTRSGMIVGTPSYISPEQARNDNVDYRSDIYSLGCLMYKTLTGRSVFRGATVVETLHAQVNEEPPSLKEGNPKLIFPDLLEQIVAKALEKDPNERFQTMDELAQALKTLRPKDPEQENSEQQGSSEQQEAPEIALPRSAILTIPMILLVVIFTVIGIVAVYTRDPVEPRRQTDAEIENEKREMLRRANHIETRTVGELVWHFPDSKKVSDEQLKSLSKLDVKRLCLAKTSVTDEQLNIIADLPLVLLDLRDTKISNKGIDIICKKMKGLQALLIERCPNVDHTGYRALNHLKNLRVLSLRDTEVSDEDLDEVCKLKGLYLLYVANSPNITNHAMDRIVKLEKLYAVRVDGTQITTSGLNKLKTLPRMMFIGMGSLNLTDDLMPQFNESVSMLDVSDNPISMKGLEGVLSLPYIWYLDVRSCAEINGHRKIVKYLNDCFRRQEGKVLLTDEVKGVETPEGYLNPELYRKGLTCFTIEERGKMIDEAFGAFARP